VQRDYEELPADAVPQLRDSLLQLLLRFGAGAPAVRTQLSLAMAALAAHLPAAQWGEGGVLRWLMDRFAGQEPATAMSCMLELLTVLPQVCQGGLREESGARTAAGLVVCGVTRECA
jgi:transportin-3